MMQVNPRSTPSEIKRFIERAKRAYDERLAAKLEPEHTGEIVAIEPESGDYFLGTNEIEAADNARTAGHEGPFYFLRVGSRYTHRLMTPRT
ncbi:MAG TPA: hypothetical protein VK582_12555 [Pyrinomonadaceae bacterium]|nr:hypothetical protein [Pyrinomonadaceae bacterium]